MKCEHIVYFKKENRNVSTGVARCHSWRAFAWCYVCNQSIKGEELLIALGRVYSPEIASLVYQNFCCLTEYYLKSSILSAHGVELPITPEKDLEKDNFE